MNKSAIQYFFAVVLCMGACRMFLAYPQQHAWDKRSSNSTEILFRNVEQEYSAKHSTISDPKGNSIPGYALPLSLLEKEESGDEDEDSEEDNQPVHLSGSHSEATFLDLLERPRKVSLVPLYILLQSWKHFLA